MSLCVYVCVFAFRRDDGASLPLSPLCPLLSPPPQGQSVLDPEFPPPPISSSPPFLSFCERRGESGYCCSRANITLSPHPYPRPSPEQSNPFLVFSFPFSNPLGRSSAMDRSHPPYSPLTVPFVSFPPPASHGQESEKRTSALFQPKPNPSSPHLPLVFLHPRAFLSSTCLRAHTKQSALVLPPLLLRCK